MTFASWKAVEILGIVRLYEVLHVAHLS
jgi:hypothetical protein